MLAPLPFTGQRGIASTKRQRQRDKFSKKQPFSSRYILAFSAFFSITSLFDTLQAMQYPRFLYRNGGRKRKSRNFAYVKERFYSRMIEP